MVSGSRKDTVFLVLAAFFVTNAVIAELIGAKLFQFGPFTMSLGVIAWPVVFLMTDLLNEYFGKEGVRRLTYITVGMILFSFFMVFTGMHIPAADFSPVNDEAFNTVFGQSLWIIVGSITAFLVSQLVDVTVFWFLRNKTGARMLWLRATGSTAVSQIIDTYIVIGVAFWLPGTLTFDKFLAVATSNYVYKFIIAVSITPIIYAAHSIIDNYLGLKDKNTA